MPVSQRFEAWGKVLSSTHLEWELVRSKQDFDAKVVARNINDLRLIGCHCDPCEGYRAPRHLGREEDYIGILFGLAGSEIIRQGDSEAVLRPGDFVIWDSRKAMEFRVLEPLHKMTILVPRRSMRRFLPELDAIAGVRIKGTESLGPLVGAHLRQLSAGLVSLEDKHLRLISDMTLELVAAGVRPKLDSLQLTGGDLYDRLRSYIDDRLWDADLTPPLIAKANGISLRYLHKIFSCRGESVSRWMLKQRLKHCHKALELETDERTITDIAFSWGFNDSAHFSRSFRKEFGTSPRSLRRETSTR